MEGVKPSKFGYYFEKKEKDIYLTPSVGEHKFTLVWMHGLGDSAQGFLDFFYSDESIISNKNTKVILLNAP